MKSIIIALLLSVATASFASAEPASSSTDAPSARDRIKMDRAKDAAAVIKDANAPRAWDKDSSGKRPWEVSVPERPR
jgi:hypothetical protein